MKNDKLFLAQVKTLPLLKTQQYYQTFGDLKRVETC